MITLTRKLEFEVLFLLIIAVIVGVVVTIFSNNSYRSQFNIILGISPVRVPAEVISPKVTISSQISPDGAKKVILKITENPDNTKAYDVLTTDANGSNNQHIFTKTLNSTKNMIIPFNTWSPDDNYFFVQENAGNLKSIFVFKVTGATFAEGQTFLDVTDLFAKADTGNSFAEATGWASETLIIINTIKVDNTKGPSYWFEVPSRAVIQLSTQF